MLAEPACRRWGLRAACRSGFITGPRAAGLDLALSQVPARSRPCFTTTQRGGCGLPVLGPARTRGGLERRWMLVLRRKVKVEPTRGHSVTMRELSTSAASLQYNSRKVDLPPLEGRKFCFDTHAVVRQLEEYGFSTKQSEVVVAALLRIMNSSMEVTYKDMATKIQQEIILQQIMSHITALKKDMIILEKSEFSAIRAANEKLKIELQQLKKQLVDEVIKVSSNNKLDLNLEKSRVQEMLTEHERRVLETRADIVELHSQEDRAVTQTNRKIDTEVAGLKTLLESHKIDTIKYLAGHGKTPKDAASVRATYPIPAACGIYYFEVKIVSKGRDGYMGIGLSAQGVNMNRLPGWDKHSYGYHGDDGHSFCSSGTGQPYGPTFTTGDVIGCCVNLINNTCFYTKNGHSLGIAFTDLPDPLYSGIICGVQYIPDAAEHLRDSCVFLSRHHISRGNETLTERPNLYPTVGLQTPGEVIDANFGQHPFVFDIEDYMREWRSKIQTQIERFPVGDREGEWQTMIQKMVSSYLVHHGYCATAEAFARSTGQAFQEELASIKNRQRIQKLVLAGRMGEAIETTQQLYPGLLERKSNLLFMLKVRQFIEMVNGTDSEVRCLGGRSPKSQDSYPGSPRTFNSPSMSPSHGTNIHILAVCKGNGAHSHFTESHNLPKQPPLALAIGQASKCLELMARLGIGSCAFATVEEYLH
uniref:ran-binding protein 9-like n=1 Tax=Pristiophorus japonicus TaxID=55135 RepID=UPI00398EE43D